MSTELSEKLWAASNGGLAIYEDLFANFEAPKKPFVLDSGGKHCNVYKAKDADVYLVKDFGSCPYENIAKGTDPIGAYADIKCHGNRLEAFKELYSKYVDKFNPGTGVEFMPADFHPKSYIEKLEVESHRIRIGHKTRSNSAGTEFQSEDRYFILSLLQIKHCLRLIPSLLRLVEKDKEFDEKILQPLEKVKNIKIWKISLLFQLTKKGWLKKNGDEIPMFFFENPKKEWELYYQPTSEKAYKWLWNRKGSDAPVFWNFANRGEHGEENINNKDIFICSGLKDALNMYLHGYRAMGLQSETNLNALHDIFKKYPSQRFVSIMDNDKTGREANAKIVLKHRKVHFIELLAMNRGKDISDALAQFPSSQFLNLTRSVHPYEKKTIRNSQGDVVDEKTIFVKENLAKLIEVLGYRRYRNFDYVKDSTFIAQQVGYFLEETHIDLLAENIKTNIENYYYNNALVNMLSNSTKDFGDIIRRVGIKDTPKIVRDPKRNRLYFQNCVLDITKDDVQEVKDPPVFLKKYAVQYAISKHNKRYFDDAGVSKMEMIRRGVNYKTIASVENGSPKMTVAGLLTYRAALQLDIFQKLL